MITRTSYVKITSWVDENTLEPFTTEEKIKYPFKKLSDEEIEEIAKNNWVWDENNMQDWSVIRFARAIIKEITNE